MDEILWFDHSNEISLAVRPMVLFVLQDLQKMKFGIFLGFLVWPLLEKVDKVQTRKCPHGLLFGLIGGYINSVFV